MFGLRLAPGPLSLGWGIGPRSRSFAWLSRFLLGGLVAGLSILVNVGSGSAQATTGSMFGTTVHQLNVSMYDGAVHSVPTHTREEAPVASHAVAAGVQAAVVTATGRSFVLFRLSVAAETAEASGNGVLARLRGFDWADDTGAVRIPGSGSRLTSSQATQMADRVGYRPTNFISRGERVFTNGKTFITQDTTAHTGGLWKMADSVQDLRAGARLGAYDYDLNWIAP